MHVFRTLSWLVPLVGGLLLAGTASPDEPSPLKSGLQSGERVSTFYVRAITGPLKNKSVCYVCRNGDRPVVMLFIREASPEVAALLKRIDAEVDAHRAEGLRAFGVFLARDSQQLLPAVQTLAFEERITTPLTIAAALADGPAGQNLHPDAAATIVLYREQKVVNNFAYRAGELTSEEMARVIDAVRRLVAE